MLNPYKLIRTSKELRQLLGSQCSPMANSVYIVGPDIHGRTCHCATHSDMNVPGAIKRVDELNDLHALRQL